MTTQTEILKFITDNSEEKLLDYFEKVCDKQKELNERINKISLYFILSALLFFILPFTINANIQVGPLTVTDKSIIYKLLPLFYSYISLEFAIVTNNKGEVMKILKLLSVHLYKQKVDNDYFKNPYRLNFFSRVVIPFSFWTELNNSLDKKVGCFGAILLLPALIVMVLPFYFEFVALKFIILNYWADWITKFSVIVSAWVILITFYFYFMTMRQTYSINKQDALN